MIVSYFIDCTFQSLEIIYTDFGENACSEPEGKKNLKKNNNKKNHPHCNESTYSTNEQKSVPVTWHF